MDTHCIRDIRVIIIGISKIMFRKMQNGQKTRCAILDLKPRLLNTCVVPVLKHGQRNLGIQQGEERKAGCLEMR